MTATTHLPRIFLSPPHMSGREASVMQEVFASNWIAPLGLVAIVRNWEVDVFDKSLLSKTRQFGYNFDTERR